MLNIEHLRGLVIRPVLQHLDMWSESAEALVLGTGVQESSLFNLRQIGPGPALGLYQCEPATHDDIWDYLDRKPEIAARVRKYVVAPDSQELIGNLNYATAICRVHYWRVPEPLPVVADIESMARYWKRVYNTEKGAGTVEGFERLYRTYVL